jgi:cell division protein FtsN
MSFKRKYLIYVSIALALIYYGCSSGEYELEEHQIDYVEKTLKIDTVKKVAVDTSQNNYKDNTSKDSYSYIVQIGAFFVKTNFDRFFARAKQTLGVEVFYEFMNNLYKIRIGKYSDKAEALKQLNFVKGYGFYDAFIVTVKK